MLQRVSAFYPADCKKFIEAEDESKRIKMDFGKAETWPGVEEQAANREGPA